LGNGNESISFFKELSKEENGAGSDCE